MSTSSSPSRALLLGVVTAVMGALALTGLPVPGSPGLAAPAAPVVGLTVAAQTLQQARPAPVAPAVAVEPVVAVSRVIAATQAAPASGSASPLADLLRRQAEAGLDCALTSRRLPLCVHGADPEPDAHDHAAHEASPGTAHGTAGSSTGTSGSIGCYGDGTSGSRVRAIYARPQSAADRFASSVGSIRDWAAGVSKHFDTSAARTKGRRHVRFATTSGESCSVTVLNVVLPDDAFSSFTATVNALQSRGLDAASSKYLVWADATGYCGVASMYADDKPGLDNLNNGAVPTYARVDRRCWGKVETHEVVHMLGGVQRSAPNSTDGGHCNDGTDLMCYDDGTEGSTQRTVCGQESAELLDCRNDDYFSTAAPKGSYLQTHWNTARSSFLSAVLSEPAPAAQPTASPAASPTPSPSPSSALPVGGGLLPGLTITLPTLPTLAPAPLVQLSAVR